MISILRTVFQGANARAEDKLKDTFAIELIDQRIRETEGQQRAAKATLASLIQRQRGEERQHDALQNRIKTLTSQAKDALDAGREELAMEAAEAVAELENEAATRSATLERLEMQVVRQRRSLEAGHRRIIDLKQGAISARAIRREHQMQSKLNSTLQGRSSADEAEELIKRVIGENDPLEEAQILDEINASLDRTDVSERLIAAGFGKSTKVTGADVLARLQK